jgi:hypothetical protein
MASHTIFLWLMSTACSKRVSSGLLAVSRLHHPAPPVFGSNSVSNHTTLDSFSIEARSISLVLSCGTAEKPGPIFQMASRASQGWLTAKVIGKPVNPEGIIPTAFVNAGGR